MGTNYYSLSVDVFRNNLERWRDFLSPLDHPEATDVLHIGKSSFGWCFALRIYPRMGIRDLGDWSPWLMSPERVIIDEYGDRVEFLKLYETITARSHPTRGPQQAPDPSWLASNRASAGPMGLARHTLGYGCVGHGAGTWDLVEGYFS